MKTLNRSAILIRPKAPYIEWAASIDEESPSLVDTLQRHTSVYLVDEIFDTSRKSRAVESCFQEVFEWELNAWDQDPGNWPGNRNLKMFHEWFDVVLPSLLLDVGNEELQSEDF